MRVVILEYYLNDKDRKLYIWYYPHEAKAKWNIVHTEGTCSNKHTIQRVCNHYFIIQNYLSLVTQTPKHVRIAIGGWVMRLTRLQHHRIRATLSCM